MGEFCQSEIEDFNLAILDQKKILRLEIAMDDSFSWAAASPRAT